MVLRRISIAKAMLIVAIIALNAAASRLDYHPEVLIGVAITGVSLEWALFCLTSPSAGIVVSGSASRCSARSHIRNGSASVKTTPEKASSSQRFRSRCRSRCKFMNSQRISRFRGAIWSHRIGACASGGTIALH